MQLQQINYLVLTVQQMRDMFASDGPFEVTVTEGTIQVNITGLPIDLRGDAPQQQNAVFNITELPTAAKAVIEVTFQVQDADFPEEGEFFVNGTFVCHLFGQQGHSGNDGAIADVKVLIPVSLLVVGDNTLTFKHVQHGGYTVESATTFEVKSNDDQSRLLGEIGQRFIDLSNL